MRHLLSSCCVCVVLATAPVRAQPVIPPPQQTAQGDVSVTIYNNNRALVEDKRVLNLPSGRSRQEFRDVSAQIEPATVTLSGRGVGVVEQNFDFDLLSPSALMENAVEEGLRRRGTSPGLFRITTRDVELGGTTIPARSLVWLVYVSAGHDESTFDDPRKFDIHRPNADKHMSFGRGRHMCMGAPLARLEARAGLEELFRRIPDIRVIPDQKLVYEPVMTVLTLRNLLTEWS